MTNTSKKPYFNLTKKWQRVAALSDAITMLSWDRQAIMPSGSGAARAEQIAILSVLKHEEMTDSLTLELVDKADTAELDDIEQKNLFEIRRIYRHAAALSPKLVEEHSRACAACEGQWQVARKENNFQVVAGSLREVVNLTQQIAAIKAETFKTNSYDSLLDEYEPGGASAQIDTIFALLEPALQKLLPEVIEYQADIDFPTYSTPVPIQNQKSLGKIIMKALGFDFLKGRLDTSVHPFSGGTPDDVRITTRYNENDWTGSLMGVIHETGHALYEQGLPSCWRGQPVGSARGMVLHESQSLLMEMQVCRSLEFFKFLAPIIAKEFMVRGDRWKAEELSNNSKRVIPNFIRVDADEITYPLHIILRYKLEKALMRGDLSVPDLPDAWNEAFESSFGMRPSDDLQGCLQDIHWYDGAFGYFPTYTLGALAAAQLFSAARKDHPDILTQISTGHFSILLNWLRKNVHSIGSALSTEEILIKATGSSLSTTAFLAHLNSRYLGKASKTY